VLVAGGYGRDEDAVLGASSAARRQLYFVEVSY
jgi:hypothetical protein